MLTFLKGVNASTSDDIKCWWQSNFSFTTCHYYCMVSTLFHHAAICPFTCLKKVAIIVRWDFWHWFRMLTTTFFTCIFRAFINVSQHSQVNMCFCKSCSSMDWKWGWNILPESFLTCSYKEPCFEIIHTQGVALAVVPTFCSVTITT